MKVFISWSGEASRELAQTLSDWMPNVLQSAHPFMSDTDIAKGDPWSAKLAVELEATHFGVVCLTPDNKDAPWLHFEAGALSKMSTIGRVAPLLFDLTPSDIQGPLARFQHTSFGKEEIRKLLRSINSAAGDGADERFGKALDALWNDLNGSVQATLAKHRPVWGQKSSMSRKPELGRVEQAVEEILGLVREGHRPSQSDRVLSLFLDDARQFFSRIGVETSKTRDALSAARAHLGLVATAMSGGPELQIPINQMLDELEQQVFRIGNEVSKARLSMEDLIFNRDKRLS
jgi:hypothetical protein